MSDFESGYYGFSDPLRARFGFYLDRAMPLTILTTERSGLSDLNMTIAAATTESLGDLRYQLERCLTNH